MPGSRSCFSRVVWVLSLTLAGCVTVRPEAKELLADPAMRFDSTAMAKPKAFFGSARCVHPRARHATPSETIRTIHRAKLGRQPRYVRTELAYNRQCSFRGLHRHR